MSQDTPTPRTDLAATNRLTTGAINGHVFQTYEVVVPVDFARQLERELTAAQLENAELRAKCARLESWNDADVTAPPIGSLRGEKPYVLAVDSRGRMSIGYAQTHSCGHVWVFAKPIGSPTHWMHLPPMPAKAASEKGAT